MTSRPLRAPLVSISATSVLCREAGGEEPTAEERFRRAREELKARDVADREAYRERRRQRAQQKRERARAHAASEAGGGGVQLAGSPPSDDSGAPTPRHFFVHHAESCCGTCDQMQVWVIRHMYCVWVVPSSQA